MKKFIGSLVITLTSLVLVVSSIVGGQNTAFAVSTNEISISVNGQKVNFPDVKPYIKNGYTLVPVRPISEALGATLNWDRANQTVTISKDDDKIILNIGSTTVMKNKVKSTIEVAPSIRDGRAMVPLRFITESLGGDVKWITSTNSVIITTTAIDNKFTAFNINGGSTGIFTRKQLNFEGFDGVQADIILPMVTIAEKGDCPYVYFGFDFNNDIGNVEGGFQFIEDSKHAHYNKWTAVIRQGKEWRWGHNIYMEQGSSHHLKFYIEEVSENQVDLILELDGIEIIRKASSVTDFSEASVKTVISMAMSKTFDGTNCQSRSEHAKITNVKVSKLDSDEYLDFNNFDLYSEFKPSVGPSGTWFGTADCIPSYLHTEPDGSISIYKE